MLWNEYRSLFRLIAEGPDDDGQMIHVFLDGSVKGNYFSYAGVFGDESAIQAFAHLWKLCLSKHGLSYFRATEAMTLNGEFAKKRNEWGGGEADEKRDRVTAEFASFYGLVGLGASSFGVSVSGLAEKQQALRKRELFQQVVGQLLQHIDRKYERIALVCDTEQDAADYFRKWLDNLQQRDEESKRIVLLAFARSVAFYPLQLADLMAYLMREEVERKNERPNDPIDPLWTHFGGPEHFLREFRLNGKLTDARGNPI
jgi:hypothetical protein